MRYFSFVLFFFAPAVVHATTLTCFYTDFVYGGFYSRGEPYYGMKGPCRDRDDREYFITLRSLGLQAGATGEGIAIYCPFNSEPVGTYFGVKAGLTIGAGLKFAQFVGKWGKPCTVVGASFGARFDVSGARMDIRPMSECQQGGCSGWETRPRR